MGIGLALLSSLCFGKVCHTLPRSQDIYFNKKSVGEHVFILGGGTVILFDEFINYILKKKANRKSP